jgi:hypothetical protein
MKINKERSKEGRKVKNGRKGGRAGSSERTKVILFPKQGKTPLGQGRWSHHAAEEVVTSVLRQ